MLYDRYFRRISASPLHYSLFVLLSDYIVSTLLAHFLSSLTLRQVVFHTGQKMTYHLLPRFLPLTLSLSRMEPVTHWLG